MTAAITEICFSALDCLILHFTEAPYCATMHLTACMVGRHCTVWSCTWWYTTALRQSTLLWWCTLPGVAAHSLFGLAEFSVALFGTINPAPFSCFLFYLCHFVMMNASHVVCAVSWTFLGNKNGSTHLWDGACTWTDFNVAVLKWHLSMFRAKFVFSTVLVFCLLADDLPPLIWGFCLL